MLKRTIPVDLIEIIWEDAETDSAWNTEVDEEEDVITTTCHTVGFLAKSTKTAYYVSHTVSTDKDGEVHWLGRTRIPKGMVKSIKVLVKGA